MRSEHDSSGSPPVTVEETTNGGLVRDPVSEPEPERLGRFLVVRRLGAGAMGVVYSAYDEDLDRRVAIKLLSRRRTHDAQRMSREAQALARINHPNVVQVYEVGRHGDQVFIAMEFVQGDTLRAWLQNTEPTRERIVEVFVQAGRGLQVAHDAQLVHRDFKPDNVILGEDGRVRVLDFGIARLGQERRDDEASVSWRPGDVASVDTEDRLTRTGQFIGTPAYMSPEQFQGLEVTAASDQFSFCIALFEALYGARPFDHSSFGNLVTSVVDGKIVEPPSNREVPKWLDDIVRRGLAPAPGDRWPSMAALLEALADDPSARRRQRIRWLFAGGAVATAVAVAWAGGDEQQQPCSGADQALAEVWSESRATALEALTETDYQRQAWTAARGGVEDWAAQWKSGFEDACRANLRGEQSDAVLDQRMRCLDRRKAELAALLGVFETSGAPALERAPDAMAKATSPARCADLERLALAVPPPEPEVADAVEALRDRYEQARAEHAVGLIEPAKAASEALVQEVRAIGYAPLLADVLRLLARSLEDAGDSSTATTLFEDAYYTALAADYREAQTMLAIDLFANLGMQQRRYDDAEPWYRTAEALLQRDGESEDHRATLLIVLGGVREQQGKLEEAERALEQTLGVRRAEDDSMAAAAVHNALGLVHQKMGAYEEAQADFERAIEQWTTHGGENHPQVADGHNNLGVLYMHMGRLEDAEQAYRRALEIRREAFGADSPLIGRVLNNLGSLAQQRQAWDEAAEWFSQAVDNFERALGKDHPALSIPLNNLGDVELEQEKPAEAQVHYERALAIDVVALGPDHRDLSFELMGLGRSLVQQGRASEAVPHLRRALELREAHDFAKQDVARCRLHLGEALEADGHRAQAIAEVKKAATEVVANTDLAEQIRTWLDAHGSP